MTEYRAPALSRGLRIIELMSNSGAPMTMRDIVAALGLSFSHLFRLMHCLVTEGYLRLDEQGYYHLTDKLTVRHPPQPISSLLHSQACRDLMKNFTWETNQPCHLAAIQNGQVRVVAHQYPEFASAIGAREGSLLNTVKSSSALLLLALADEQSSWSLIRNYKLDATLRGVMVEQLSTIAAQGFAEIAHDRIVGLTSVSWPVIGENGAASAAITCPYFDRVPGDFANVRRELSKLAMALGGLLSK